jgi:hypothetical protein
MPRNLQKRPSLEKRESAALSPLVLFDGRRLPPHLPEIPQVEIRIPSGGGKVAKL